MSKLRAGGLGEQVDSWVSTGSNAPVQPAQLEQALGPDTVQRLSAGSGLNVGQLLPLLAAFLPQIINMLTPKGNVPSGGLEPGRHARHRRPAGRSDGRCRRAAAPAAPGWTTSSAAWAGCSEAPRQ